MLKGVSNVEPGYAGGTMANPTYERVSAGMTGHAEVIRVTYDPSLISYEDLLVVFFGSHDPTTVNRQGNDVGEQYRSVVFYANDSEKNTAEKLIREIEPTLSHGSHVVTQLVPFSDFYPAEGYHMNYYAENRSAPYCELVIEPKIEKVRKRFSDLIA